jgi:PAS domain S-box-containing protein
VSATREPRRKGEAQAATKVAGAPRSRSARLREEQRYRALVEIASDWIWEMDSELRFSYFSPNYEAASGNRPADLIGKSRAEFAGAAIHSAEWRDHLATLAAHKPFRDFVYRYRHRDGRVRWIKISGSPFVDADGRFAGYNGNGTDITAQVEAQERLRESEERFRQLFESASDWFWESDAEGRLTFVSPKHEQVTGSVRSKNIGLRREEYSDIAANPDGWRAYQAAVAERRPFRDFIWRHLRPDANGRFRWTKTSGVPVFAADGTFQGYRGAASDVTAQMEAEARRRELEAQLQQSQKLEALGQLAGGVAHDLNNALVPVLAMAKFVMAKLPSGSSERDCLELIQQGGMRAKELVQQILAFSRKEAPEKRVLDLASLVDGTLAMLQASIPASIRLVVETEAVPAILGDANRLHQVIVNLVTNAAHAIGPVAGTITLTLRPQGGSEVLLRVSDTGCGMDRTTMARIFEPFYTTKEVGKGTGLGLSVVHGIVKSHGGTIAVTSRPGAGARFDILLPAVSSRPAGSRAEAVPAAVAAS